jgi:hypothetical protein
LLGTAVEHALEGLEIADAFVGDDIPRPCPGMVVASFVGFCWLI